MATLTHPFVSFETDPLISADAGQFIRVELLDHFEVCCDEGCEAETRIAATSHESVKSMPYCSAHMHVVFADWMVGA